MKRKLLSVLLTLCLAFSLLPTAALAEEGEAARTGDLTYTTADETISGFTYTSGTITINAENVTVENVTFGDGARLEVNTPGRFTLKNCTFNGKTEVRTPVMLNVGSATVTGNTFNGTKEDGTPSYYNAIEFAVSSGNKLSSATLSNNIFEAAIKNNYFSTYYYADNAVITAENNVIKLANRGSNAIRISNVTNSNVTFNLNNNSYEFSDASGSSEYEGFIILQDFTKKSGNTEDFSKVTINISNLTSPSDASRLFYVWEDSVGLVSDNNPVIKGDSSIEKFFTAKVGDTYYKTLADAVAAAKADEATTITLLKDVELPSYIYIKDKKNITLDLNGKNITRTGNGVFYVGNAKLRVTGTGTIFENQRDGFAPIIAKGSPNDVADYTTITIDENVTLKGDYAGIFVDTDTAGKNSYHNYGLVINMKGSIDLTAIDGGVSAYGVYVQGLNKITSGNVMQINLDGVTINTGDEAIYAAGYAKWNVKNCTFNAENAAIEVRAGDMTIDGGVYTAMASEFKCEANGNGSTTQGAALAIMQHTTKLPISVYVKNGVFHSAAAVAEKNIQKNDPKPNVDLQIADGQFNGVVVADDVLNFISGGYYTSDPSAYKAEGKFVVASDKAGYSYMISGTAPTKAEVIVNDKTAVTVPTNENLTNADKTAIQTKTNIDGVAEAVVGSKDAIVKKAGVDASAVDASKLIEVEVAVDVAVSDVQKNAEGTAISTITFTAKPTATVKVDGTATDTTVPVTNDMLNGKPITVKLPLPAGFTPEQIKHISSDRSVEYFLRTAKSGAKLFTVDSDNCAVFTITKFSTFELSGTVTYVEPSYYSGSSSYDPTYSVSTPSKTEHGTVTVSPKNASKGDRVTVTVKPDSGYVLETLTVTDKNGNELTLKDKGDGKYTFTMPAGKVEVKATFMEDNSVLNFFYDVPNDAYFYEAVKWAVKNGITTGVGNDLFAPEQPCTRAQIVTFLWRAAGSPEPKTASSFTDVPANAYYAKAVAWAVENGITNGMTETEFAPDATCTRGQSVTFLHRALKGTASGSTNFTDVASDAFYADAINWAVANNVTNGTSNTTFSPNADCTRAEIVTFLYRAYQGK